MDRRCEPVHPESVSDRSFAPGFAAHPVITGRHGSSTLAWHAVVPPRGALPSYSLGACNEILVLVKGRGTACQDGEHAALRGGHCWLCPARAERSFRNDSPTDPATLVGFWPGAADSKEAGFAGAGSRPENSGQPVACFRRGILIHVDDVTPEKMNVGEGWSISDFRLPLGRHNGSTTTLFRARFLPGAVHRRHRHDRCEEIYHVISGRGIAGAGGGRGEVCGGHFHFIPAGVEHWLVNMEDDAPVEVVGIYVGAGSVEETGYVYMGDVTAADLE